MPISPKDKLILKVLNLLSLLYTANSQKVSNVSDSEHYFLNVTEEHLNKEGLTTAEFLNTLKVLSEKGYLIATGFFEDEWRKVYKEASTDRNYDGAMAELAKLNDGKYTPELKKIALEIAKKMLPPGREIDEKAFLEADIPLDTYSKSAKSIMGNINGEIVARVTLSPYRTIQSLLEKMNAGQSFAEIQEKYAWYDGEKYEFHVGDEIIATSYNGKPNVEHAVLAKIKDNLEDGIIGYEEFGEYSPNSLRLALIRFIDKHEKLSAIFSVHTGYLKFNQEYFN